MADPDTAPPRLGSQYRFRRLLPWSRLDPRHLVPAGNGVTWWSEGWRYFAASPWVWIGITVAFIAIMILLGFVPFLGNFASTVLAPVLAAGMMAGCNAQDRGGELTFEHLFSGFSDRLAPLMVVGLLYLAGTVAIVLIVARLRSQPSG